MVFIRIYRPAYAHEKETFWQMLAQLHNCINELWLIIGDEVLSFDENIGGRCVGVKSRNYLQQFIQDTGFVDLGNIRQ